MLPTKIHTSTYAQAMSSISIPIFILLLASSILFKLSSAANCHADDEAGLLAFKSAITADPSGLLSSWKRGTACCSWFGVTCLNGNRVTSLSLYGQPDNPKSFLSGTISPSLSKLTSLDSIYLVNTRNLSGPFPTFFFHLPKFLYIYIENNKLSGPLPANIGDLKNLGALSLFGNRFSGSIPSSISKLTGLSQLRLGGNLFTGPIPDGIRLLKDLGSLDLGRNQLSGPIPDIFGALLNLRSLDLTHNKLTGPIPASISALAPILRFLELGHNSLTGKIPTFLAKFQDLDTLDLGSNRFSGVVPKSFVNLTKIFNLDLSHNLLTDPFPALKVKGIESLDLSYNSFHLGTIPKWVTSSPIIYSLKLAKCGIKIKLDDWKPTQTYFYDYIDLSENNVSGSPVALLNRTEYLVSFKATGTQLKFNMSNLIFPKTLKDLDISRTLVFGSVPPAITQLKTFNVSHNQQICGRLPPNNFTADSFAGDGCLCGAPLFPCCPRCG